MGVVISYSLLLATYYLLLATYSLLLSTSYLLLTPYSLLLTTYSLYSRQLATRGLRQAVAYKKMLRFSC